MTLTKHYKKHKSLTNTQLLICFAFTFVAATGCRFDKKPAFRYSGCHAYELSALNVVLGRMFNFDESKYIIDDKYKFFAKVSDFEDEDEGEHPDKGNNKVKDEILNDQEYKIP